VCEDRGSPSVPGVGMRPLASTRLLPNVCVGCCAAGVVKCIGNGVTGVAYTMTDGINLAL
jgi:hypothetical protein